MSLKTLKIQETTHKELTKVKGAITSETGIDTTYDEAIMSLIREWHQKNPKDNRK